MLADLLKEPSGQFENFCRMSNEDFGYLLTQVEPLIAKKNTKWRNAIPPNERLAITLRFLATGDSFSSLHYLFKISPQAISTIVPEVCSAIIKVLQKYVKVGINTHDMLIFKPSLIIRPTINNLCRLTRGNCNFFKLMKLWLEENDSKIV